MKNIFRFLMSAAILFGAVSCAKEDISSSLAGGEVEVTLSVDVPELGTRAFGDGLTVDQLFIAVYEQDGTVALPISHIDGTGFQGSEAFSGGRATVTMVLLKDKTYDLVFWAQNAAANAAANPEDNAYTVNLADGRNIEANYGALCNLEDRDAFFLIRNDWKAGVDETTFKLNRPFAQINVANSNEDVKFVTANGATIETSALTVNTKVANVLDMKTGDVDGSVDVAFAENAIPTEAFHIAGYNYLAMNYLLVKEKELVNLEFVFTDNKGVEYTREYGNVPVQRNYRTNILGQIISSPIDFTVVIDPIFNEVEHEVDENGTKSVAVDSVDDLATIAEQINNGELPTDTNIVLNGDIDLNATRSTESNWTPIGTSEQPFTGTFDGKGYTIKNLTLVENEAKEGKAYIGFFGYAKDATIKNITFENVYINIPCLDIDHSQGHIGAVAGSLEGTSTIENVTVEGLIQVYATQDANGASRVAVVAGGNSYGNVTMKNVHVDASEGSYLIANNNTGALAGQLQGKMVFENCSSNIDVTVNKFFAGGLVGIAAGDSYFKNCHTTGDVAVVAGREGRHNDEYRVGGIAGGWADGKTKVCTLENCSYTGNVSGKNADGAVAEPLDYMGYVGRGYTLANCAGSKVVIDGKAFVQVYDNVYGVYTINGCTPVSTADELVAALEANEGVYLLNDIKIDPAAMSNAYGKTGINIKNGQTIDGAGHTLNIKGAGGTWDSGINTTGGLIKNLTVTGSFRGIFINHTSTHSEKVVLENVTLEDVVYTISCDQGLYQTIEATNCSFYGWTSFAKTAGEAKFVNCYFGEGNGYKYCRPYSNTEFVGCTFCPGYAVDQTQATVTFTDCTWEK